MKRLIFILAAAGFASAAGAQQPTEVEQSLERGAAAVGTEASDEAVSDRNCLRHTGSHITASENAKARRAGKKQEECANAFGRAYDREDIERTGAMDVEQALQMLDPAIH